MSKDTLTEKLVKAYEADDYPIARHLMEGYSAAKMGAAYRAVEKIEGYVAAQAARRGEWTRSGAFFGICSGPR